MDGRGEDLRLGSAWLNQPDSPILAGLVRWYFLRWWDHDRHVTGCKRQNAHPSNCRRVLTRSFHRSLREDGCACQSLRLTLSAF